MSLVVHMVAGVDRKEGETGGGECLDILLSLEVIGIRAPRQPPALLKNAPDGVIHHVPWGAASSGIFAHRLLGKDRCDGRLRFANPPQSADMAGGRETQTIAKSCRCLEPQRNRPEPRQSLPQCCGIGR